MQQAMNDLGDSLNIVGGGETGGIAELPGVCLPGCEMGLKHLEGGRFRCIFEAPKESWRNSSVGRVVCFLGMAILGQSEECLGCVCVCY